MAQPEPEHIALAEDTITRYRRDPVAFVRECFDVEPDWWQAEVLAAFPTNRRIAMQAAKGPGKTALLAWLIWNFMLNENANVAATSISGDNLRANLWKELAYWRDKCSWIKQTYEMTATRIFVPDTLENQYERTWFCEARTWAKSADEGTQALSLAGLHSKYCMAVMDESGGMPDAMMVAAEGVLANVIDGDGSRGHIVQAGNPTMLSGPLYRSATRERSLWFVICITGDPDDPKRSPRISLQWAKEQIQKYGRDNPWVLVNVFGQFPPSSLSALIGPDDVRRAIGRHLLEHQYKFAAKIIGVDVARYGDDVSVIWPRQGLAAFEPIVLRNADSNEGAGRVATMAQDWEADAECVDATGGFGAGWIDALSLMGHTAMEVQFQGKAIEAKFGNKRAEMIWGLVQWIKSGGALPPCEASDRLLEELTEIQYCFKADKIYIEEKDQIKQRLGRSPDYSDALGCTFAFPIAPRERDILAGVGGRGDYNRALTQYDPLERP